MSLAKLLKKTYAEDKGEIYLSDIVDEQVLKYKKFSYLYLRAKTLDFLKVLESGKFNRDELWLKFFQLYEAMYAPEKRGENVFHPSSLEGDCERKLFYDLSKIPISDKVSKKVDGKLQKIFDVGTWWHTYIQYQLYKAGILIQGEIEVVNLKRYIQGKGDGIIKINGKYYLLEIKSMNSFVYAKAKVEPFKSHKFQAGIYLTELQKTYKHKIEGIWFLYVNKDNGEFKEFIHVPEKRYIAEAYDKMDGVIKAVKSKAAPKRTCLHKVSEKALYCPYATLCFKNK